MPEILKIGIEVFDIDDFRERTRVRITGLDKLLENREHQELAYGAIDAMAEAWAVSRFGRLYEVTENAIVNDQTGALLNIGSAAGAAVASLKGNTLAKLVDDNPAMKDGKPVFHADHGNLVEVVTPVVLEGNLKEAALKMRKQTFGEGDNLQIIDIRPKYLLVPAEREAEALKAVASVTAGNTGDVNPFAGRLEVVVEPRLSDPDSWYLFSDPVMHSGIEYGSLYGDGSPQVETGKPITSYSTHTRVTAYFGAGWIDHRGAVKVTQIPE